MGILQVFPVKVGLVSLKIITPEVPQHPNHTIAMPVLVSLYPGFDRHLTQAPNLKPVRGRKPRARATNQEYCVALWGS